MKERRRIAPGRGVSLLLLVVGVLMLVGGASAAIGDGGVIYGCYSNTSGALRVINYPAQNCTATETRLPWNQTGPPGAQGATDSPAAAGVHSETDLLHWLLPKGFGAQGWSPRAGVGGVGA